MNFLLKVLFRHIPTDYFSRKYPVSVKGIVLVNKRIVLLKNEREEWELPGGKLEPAESAEQCVIREIREELNLETTVSTLVDTWMYNVLGKVKVLIVTYYCNPLEINQDLVKISHEHKEVGFFKPEEIGGLNMPEGYKKSISIALERQKEKSSTIH
jgi:8-oxo-dGTP pyrophosphatase MutT (NUDIX family)